jgi:hypothetical protein
MHGLTFSATINMNTNWVMGNIRCSSMKPSKQKPKKKNNEIDSQRTNRTMTRRSVLQAVGATAIMGTTVTGLVRGSSSNGVTHLRGSYDSPVPVERIRKSHQITAQSGRSQGSQVSAEPSFPKKARIVDYIVVPRGNGIPQQFVGAAGNPQSVDNVHARAEEKAQTFRKNTKNLSSNSADGLISRSQVGGEWIRVTPGDDEAYLADQPYGAVQCNFDWYALPNNLEESGRDTHAFRQYHAMRPGKKLWGGDWQNEYARAFHWWDVNQALNPELKKWGPDSPSGSQYNVSLAVSAEPLSWSFPINNTELTVKTDFTAPLGEWKWQIWGNKYREQTMGFQPGSTAEIGEQRCGRHHFITLRSSAGFQNELTPWNRKLIWTGWNLVTNFGSC